MVVVVAVVVVVVVNIFTLGRFWLVRLVNRKVLANPNQFYVLDKYLPPRTREFQNFLYSGK